MPSNEGRDQTLGPFDKNHPEFFAPAFERLEASVLRYRRDLERASRIAAVRDRVDVISTKHVEQAEEALSCLSPQGGALGVNPHIWWLSAGICFAVALALPDASTLFFGDIHGRHLWTAICVIFIGLFILGLLAAGVAFLLALGPLKPHWFVKLELGLAKLVKK